MSRSRRAKAADRAKKRKEKEKERQLQYRESRRQRELALHQADKHDDDQPGYLHHYPRDGDQTAHDEEEKERERRITMEVDEAARAARYDAMKEPDRFRVGRMGYEPDTRHAPSHPKPKKGKGKGNGKRTGKGGGGGG